MRKLISKKAIPLIFILGSLVFNFTFAYAAKSVSELNKERQDLKQQSQDAKQSLEETQTEKKSVLSEVERLDNELNKAQQELNKLTNELDDTKTKLSESETSLEKATKDKDEQYDTLKKRICVMYESGSVGYLQLILESTGFSDFLKRLEYVETIMEYDDKILEKYKNTEEDIKDTVESIKKDKERIESLTEEQAKRKQVLDESLKIKEEMVAKLSKQEDTYNQQLKDLDDADKDVAALIEKAQAKAKAAAAAAASSGSSYTSSNKVYSYSGGKLQYPVPAYSGYAPNSPYGYRSSPISGKSEFHTGVDLKATRNTDIVAAESGTVIYAGAKGGYGNTVIIDHGNGLSTLYAHNTSVCVSVGQSVTRGQVIAKAGTTGYSTGVHSHFEVRINGHHTNPMPYLKG